MIKRILLAAGMAVLLGACGFHLRGSGEAKLAFNELDVQARDEHGDTVRELTRVLEGSGVKVHPGAPYKLVLVDEQQTQRVASRTGAARSAEYQATTQLEYQLRTANDLVLLDNTLETSRTYVHDNNNVISSSLEQDQLQREMRSELIRQLLLRLQSLTPQQLAQLQQDAQAKAKAAAEAEEAARRQREAATAPQQSPLQLPMPTR